jgi:hypothetical protein
MDFIIGIINVTIKLIVKTLSTVVICPSIWKYSGATFTVLTTKLYITRKL